MKNPGDIPTQIKDRELVDQRRMQIVDAAVGLFVDKGFHRTTTREIAAAAGISIGLLYEYVTSKEDVLYLVCEAIHKEVEKGVSEALQSKTQGYQKLAEIIREYFLVCHRMSDHILLIYQETRTLSSPWRRRVLENELRITEIFVKALEELVKSNQISNLSPRMINLIAHNIAVLGHMWTFRRWSLSHQYSIEEYTKLQTEFILAKFKAG